MPRIFIVTGEASGDLHGAHLAAGLKALRPDLQLVGVGGARMQAAGVELLQGIDRADFVGLFGLGHFLKAARAFAAQARLLRSTAFDVVVFIDHPGMNLRLARVAAAAGHRVVYYIAPQIWAWGANRLRLIARVVHRMIVVLPFEAGIYRSAGLTCDFVGHPLLDDIAPSYDRAGLRARFGLKEDRRVLGLLPGSRERELRALLPLMLEAAGDLAARHPDLQFVLAQADSISDALLHELLAPARIPVRVVRGQASEVMAASDLLVVASGTATLQAAVVGTPMVIVYRVSWPTYVVGRLLLECNTIRILHHLRCIGLANLVAGRKIIPELIQRGATAERVTREADRLLSDAGAAAEMRRALRAVRESLGEPGASRRAAEAVLAECKG